MLIERDNRIPPPKLSGVTYIVQNDVKRCLQNVEDLKKMHIRNWKVTSRDKNTWKRIMKEATKAIYSGCVGPEGKVILKQFFGGILNDI